MKTELAPPQQDEPDLLLLGHTEMDRTHEEFLELWQKTVAADKATFSMQLSELRAHTERHFAREEGLMQTSGFPAIAEHRADHQRILGEMSRLVVRASQGTTTMARAWLKEQIPHWFQTHLRTMDSALAAHLRHGTQGETPTHPRPKISPEL